ncbi:hypothetical protein TRVL_00403 [Trypanosoma vivax]|nr:hypothetical protein TRVL_00403 [Trypanosoma vivax]
MFVHGEVGQGQRMEQQREGPQWKQRSLAKAAGKRFDFQQVLAFGVGISAYLPCPALAIHGAAATREKCVPKHHPIGGTNAGRRQAHVPLRAPRTKATNLSGDNSGEDKGRCGERRSRFLSPQPSPA